MQGDTIERSCRGDSRLDVDLVHLVHVDRHAVCRVQLLVALAALPVLACTEKVAKNVSSERRRSDAPIQSNMATTERLAFLVEDQGRLIAENPITIEAEYHLLLLQQSRNKRRCRAPGVFQVSLAALDQERPAASTEHDAAFTHLVCRLPFADHVSEQACWRPDARETASGSQRCTQTVPPAMCYGFLCSHVCCVLPVNARLGPHRVQARDSLSLHCYCSRVLQRRSKRSCHRSRQTSP